MSEHSTLANVQMSTNVAINVDMSNSTDLTQVVQYLLSTVQTLQQRVTTHDDLLAQLTALRSENSTLKAEIANVKAQLNAASGDSVAKATSLSVSAPSLSVPSVPVPGVEQMSSTARPTYSAVAARPAARSPNKKRKLAASRAFQPVDPEAPRGFQYLYLNRNRKLTRSEIRRNLRLLGLDLSRVLDVCFPGPKTIGLLVHVQYKEEVVSLFSTVCCIMAKVIEERIKKIKKQFVYFLRLIFISV